MVISCSISAKKLAHYKFENYIHVLLYHCRWQVLPIITTLKVPGIGNICLQMMLFYLLLMSDVLRSNFHLTVMQPEFILKIPSIKNVLKL